MEHELIKTVTKPHNWVNRKVVGEWKAPANVYDPTFRPHTG